VNLSQEQITELDADVVFVATWNDPKNESKDVKAGFQGNPLWSKPTGKVVEVDDHTWVSSVGLQGTNSMLTDIAKQFGVHAA
jgi:iron complex transport system substrate-binding protein